MICFGRFSRLQAGKPVYTTFYDFVFYSSVSNIEIITRSDTVKTR